MEAEIEKQAAEYTLQLFGADSTAVDNVRNWLTARVAYLLNNDFNALVNLLYRIDVYESKAKSCFGQPNDKIAECLAQLIWERQIQKARTRMGQ